MADTPPLECSLLVYWVILCKIMILSSFTINMWDLKYIYLVGQKSPKFLCCLGNSYAVHFCIYFLSLMISVSISVSPVATDNVAGNAYTMSHGLQIILWISINWNYENIFYTSKFPFYEFHSSLVHKHWRCIVPLFFFALFPYLKTDNCKKN